MEIITTLPGDKNFQLFEDLPKQLYPSNSIKHLQSENINKEFLVACYVLIDKKEVKARAALYNNPHLIYNAKNAVCIGNYECVENNIVASTLLNFVMNEARKLNALQLIGPMNGSTWDNYRFSVHNDNPNFLLEPYHHLYYNQQFKDNGFDTIAEYISNIEYELTEEHPDLLKREAEFVAQGVKIRNINMDNYEGELKKLYPFITNAFKSNFLYTPIKWETFLAKYLEASKIINPEYVRLAEDVNGNIIGFVFAYDDLFNTTEKCLVVKTLARNESKQWAGLGQVMCNPFLKIAKEKNYKSIIHAFVLKQGTSVGTSEKFLGKVYKNYALYSKAL